LPQDFGIVARYVSHKSKIQVFFQVSVLDAILRTRRLMLLRVFFQRFGEAHRRDARLVKWIVVSAAPETIHAKNHANRSAAVNFFNCTRQFARRGIAIINGPVSREDSYSMRSSRRPIGAHDVVIEHSAHCVSLLLQPFQKVRAPQKALFLARYGSKQNCRTEV
jgi:hypothetical protein